jgi:hypothetical protein
MIHRPADIWKAGVPRDEQIDIAAQIQREGKVPVFVTLTDDPVMDLVVGRLKIINHDQP